MFNPNDVVTVTPKYRGGDSNVKIDKVTITNSYTIIEMSWVNRLYANGVCSIDKAAKLNVQGKKYMLFKSEGISYEPEKTKVEYGKTLKFKLYFQPIPKNTKSFDLIENETSSWKFYNVELSTLDNSSVLPDGSSSSSHSSVAPNSSRASSNYVVGPNDVVKVNPKYNCFDTKIKIDKVVPS